MVAVGLLALAVGILSGGGGAVHLGRYPLVGRSAPDFELTGLDGSTVRLADYRGRPVIVNFWASWCIPCREEFPLFAAARRQHAADGLEILGVVYRDRADGARRFMADHGATWPAALDPDGAVAAAYGVGAVPVSLYIDGGGIVRSVSYGAPPSGRMEALLATILPRAPATSSPGASSPATSSPGAPSPSAP